MSGSQGGYHTRAHARGVVHTRRQHFPGHSGRVRPTTRSRLGGVPDLTLAQRRAREERVLLTNDRQLAVTARDTACVMLVPGNGIADAARALRRAFNLDWQYAPFTRCLVDNQLLESAAPELTARVPERSRAAGGPLRVCPECGRLYWPGGHVRRMQQQLAVWQREVAPGGSRQRLKRSGRF